MPAKTKFQLSEGTASVLEWPDFLRFYSDFATASAAKERILQLQPVESLEEEAALTREALRAAQANLIPSLDGLEDISLLLQKTRIENHVCEGVDLYRIYRACALNNRIRAATGNWGRDYPAISARCSRLPDLTALEQEIEHKIEPSGEVREDATTELAKLHKQILQTQSRAERALERYFRDSRYKDSLQEDYVTYRHGRAVLLVRSEQKNAIRGVVHGESGSGASIFVEPFPVVELNNELARLRDRQAEEIHRILKELSRLAGAHADVIEFALREMTSLEMIFVRGRFGKTFRCIVPELSSEFAFRVIKARHPLLEAALQQQQKEIVPFTFDLPANKKAFIITGPNTGGKTVFLKTIGLLSIMAHCAIPVPAEEGTVLPVLNSVAADIGDQQSIADSLSTFSSHITHIVAILSGLRERSLVLLDELGTGTDPEEGAPLAVAILQELLQKNVKVFITSHHSAMKIFAFQHPDCVTAAMEFDPVLLLPTYRMQIDQVGASHAFEIAERLGLQSRILDSARQLTDVSQRQIQELQSRLQERIRLLEKRQHNLEQEKVEWETSARDQQSKMDQLQEKLEHQRKTLKEQNVDLVRTLNARVENLLSSIRDAEVRRQLRKQYESGVAPVIEQLRETTASQTELPAASDLDFNPGDRVWVQLYKDFGEVAGIRKDTAEVIIRNKRFQIPVSMIEKKEPISKALPKGIEIHLQEKAISGELNLIGKTVEEASTELDKYLDDAFVNQLSEVRIIHGHGTGRLKKGVAGLLASHPHVKSFGQESQERGGAAVTVVQLKSR